MYQVHSRPTLEHRGQGLRPLGHALSLEGGEGRPPSSWSALSGGGLVLAVLWGAELPPFLFVYNLCRFRFWVPPPIISVLRSCRHSSHYGTQTTPCHTFSYISYLPNSKSSWNFQLMCARSRTYFLHFFFLLVHTDNRSRILVRYALSAIFDGSILYSQ